MPSSQPRPSYSESMQLLGGFEWILDFENLHQRSRLHWCRHRNFSASIHASQAAHSYLVALTLGGWVRLGRMSGKSRKLGPSHRTSCWMALHTHPLSPLCILCSPCKLVSCWLVRGGKSRKHLGTNKRLPKPVDSMVKAGCPVQVVVGISSL